MSALRGDDCIARPRLSEEWLAASLRALRTAGLAGRDLRTAQ